MTTEQCKETLFGPKLPIVACPCQDLVLHFVYGGVHFALEVSTVSPYMWHSSCIMGRKMLEGWGYISSIWTRKFTRKVIMCSCEKHS